MRYIKGTTTFGLFYSSSKKIEIVGYSDSDWSGDSDERKSTSGNYFMIVKTVAYGHQRNSQLLHYLLVKLSM